MRQVDVIGRVQPLLNGSIEKVWFSFAGLEIGLVVETCGPKDAPLLLLLPAISTVSSRGEWSSFTKVIENKYHVVSFDWPGFGDSDRPKIKYDSKILRIALRTIFDYLTQFKQEKFTVLTAGHSACIALDLADEYSQNWNQLILVAPTWRGPLPTMTGWYPAKFGWLRQLVLLPVVGPIFYHLNTSRFILKLMLRRHVWVDTSLLTAKQIFEQQKLSRRSGSRFASISFVSGGFDPAGDRSWWFEQVKRLKCSMHVVVAMDAPPRSKREMDLLADYAQQVSEIKGRLGLHQEFGAILCERVLSV